MQPVDRLAAILDRFTVRARRFHIGPLCELQRFEAVPGRGFLHILRAGRLVVTDGPTSTRRVVSEPSLLFYPRPQEHTFNARSDSSVDLACASLDFDGGADHPLVRALPDSVTLPITEVAGLDRSLDLLYDEADEFRCGHHHVIDRLFEITLLKLVRWLLDHPRRIGLPPGLLGGMADPGIAGALTAMHADPGRAWTLETLGTTARMSRSAFAARFRELVGTTPHDYLTAWRMTIGRQLLCQGRPIAQIAAELGYTSSSFSRVFVQRLGKSPRIWAQENRSKQAPRASLRSVTTSAIRSPFRRAENGGCGRRLRSTLRQPLRFRDPSPE